MILRLWDHEWHATLVYKAFRIIPSNVKMTKFVALLMVERPLTCSCHKCATTWSYYVCTYSSHTKPPLHCFFREPMQQRMICIQHTLPFMYHDNIQVTSRNRWTYLGGFVGLGLYSCPNVEVGSKRSNIQSSIWLSNKKWEQRIEE